MKNYQKPQVDIMAMLNKENISSGLNNWLNGAGSEYANAGITTYVVQS